MKFAIQNILKSRWRWLYLLLTIGILLVFIVPLPRFDNPTSTVVLSVEKELLGARIAADGQWRFPKTDSIPDQYEKALLRYEDQWFYHHPGINPVALARAFLLNIKYKKVISGGSTLSMQVARLSRNNPPRNIPGKLLEMAMALKMEIFYSKKEILKLYASNAPFGGNVVGIDAASWRYFNRPAHQLSWAETATLAVLPNAPALIYPGKNQESLKKKRDHLLYRLLEDGTIDSMTYRISLAESIFEKPKVLPDFADHAVNYLAQFHKGRKIISTLKSDWQKKSVMIASRHGSILAENDIHNLALVIIEVKTGAILSYVGNTPGISNRYASHVDIARAPRSTGSILKPFLYASMLEYGEMMPNGLIKDTPINFSGYAPKNFDYAYTGAIPAAQALSQSRNIPAVEMLYQFGEARFLDILRNLGLTTFNHSAEHYGLSLILGGGEANLLQLAGAYTAMAARLNNYASADNYQETEINLPHFIPAEKRAENLPKNFPFKAASIYATFNALQKVNRPEGRTGWWNFNSTNKVAWKTGTSFGFRDAWAIGTTPEYVVAVWCGNASGEGRAGLTGTKTAAPVLFDVFDFLPPSGWFSAPTEELTTVEVCNESGLKASALCPHKLVETIPVTALKTTACTYHHLVHLSTDRQWQVNASCYPLKQMVHDSIFILPPAMEWYYRLNHPEYNSLPPFLPGCESGNSLKSIEIISPRNLSRLYVPLEINGDRGRIVFEAAHRNMNTRLFWHLDGTFIGETDHFHQMALAPAEGVHTLTILDKEGNSLETHFTILTKKN